jgi:hypothetical protein
MPSTILLRATGLTTSPNELTRQDGSLNVASNIVIRRDNIIEPRRGFPLYGTSFGTSTDTANQLLTYQHRILKHYNSTLSYDSDGVGTWADFSGTYSEPATGRRLRSIESNGNFYFTSDTGIKKISATSASEFSTSSGYITQAGGVKAIDIQTRLKVTPGDTASFFTQDSTVGYRVCWGYNDANNNLVLGTPSQYNQIYNPLLSLLLMDFNRVVGTLDDIATGITADTNLLGTLIDNENYATTYALTASSAATSIRNNLIGLASKIDNDLLYANDTGTNALLKVFTGTATGNTTNGSASITTLSSTTNLIVGLGVSGAGIPSGAVITQISGTTITISANATATAAGVTLTFTPGITTGTSANTATVGVVASASTLTTTGNTTNGSNQLTTLASTAGILQNMLVSGTGIPSGTYVSSVVGSTVTLSQNATATAAGVSVTFALSPLNFWSVGSYVYLNSFTGTGGTAINGLQLIGTVSALGFTFSTAAAQNPITITGASIVSGEYRNLKDSSGALYSAVAIPDTPATNGELTYLQSYLQAIITRLQVEPTSVILATIQTNFLSLLSLTTTAQVVLDIGIPSTVTSAHFFQIYRSATAQASSTQVLTTDVFSNDELQLVYEAFPTAAQLAAGVVTVTDITLDFFRGANLYTNPYSGEGPTQANDVPPAAMDINVFKNTVFFANTRTRHRISLNLLGVANMIANYNAGTTPNLLVSNTVKTNTYNFVTGVQQVVTFTCVADVANSLNGKYITINSANNYNKYYIWYKTSGGSTSDPAVSGRTGIKVYVNTGETATNVAIKTAHAVAQYIFDFTATSSTTNVIITNTLQGYADNGAIGTSGFTVALTTAGRGERYTQETTALTMPAGSTFTTVGTANYFTLNTPFNHTQYYVWYKVGSSVDPAITGKTGIQVTIGAGDTAAQVATKTQVAIAAVSTSFTASVLSTVVTVTNVAYGPAQDITASMPGGFSSSVTQQGSLEVLLSTNTSPATAVDETARSLVRIINRNTQDASYAYYTSTVLGVPGEMVLESRVLDTNTIYLLANNTTTGASFSPDLSPTKSISAIATGLPATVTAAGHGLVNGDYVVITNTDSYPCADGVYLVSAATTNTFQIQLNVTTAATKGVLIKSTQGQFSSNEVKSNRIYYAKNLQPEAVPIVNYFDVGAVNRAILRIFPLRDSLFVFKEDGLWRVSGETAPYTVALFDSSYIVLAPDSLDVSNNVIYAWTTQGISTATEAGTKPISRVIDVDILKLAASNYNPNFKTVTWGIGYESDNSYTVYVGANPTDEVGTTGYRYSNLTNSWTTVDLEATCGIINPADDRMYMGAGDTNYVLQERKSFDRTDYADREVATSLLTGNLITPTQIILGSVENINVGDVLSQVQYLTIYEYNQLLKKLDADPNLSFKNYYSSQVASAGDDLQLKLYNPATPSGLAVKLDSEPSIASHNFVSTVSTKSGTITSNSAATATVITTSASHGLSNGRIVTITGVSGSVPAINGTYEVTVISPTTFSIPVTTTVAGTGGSFITVGNDFRDIRACFTAICAGLNADSGPAFKNYTSLSTTSEQEAVITDVSLSTRTITLNLPIPWVVGAMTVYNAIHSTFTYAPNDMMASQGESVIPQGAGDSLMLKHLREATVIFDNQTFTSATVSFATDLVQSFTDVQITGSGNGIFGFNSFGSGFFGGLGASVPFRTYIPRDCQRCRYVVIKFSHAVAREKYSILGISVTGEVGQSTRAYR